MYTELDVVLMILFQIIIYSHIIKSNETVEILAGSKF